MVQYRYRLGDTLSLNSSNICELKQYIVNKNKALEVTSVTKANPAVVTSAAHGLSAGDTILGYGSGNSNFDGKIFTVSLGNLSADTFELQDTNSNNIDFSGLANALTSGYVKKMNSNQIGIQSVVAAENGEFTTGDNHGLSVGDYVFSQNAGVDNGVYKITDVSGGNNKFKMRSVDCHDNESNITPTLIENGGNGAHVALINLYSNDAVTVIQGVAIKNGSVKGNVTGDLDGNVDGNVVGNVTGNVKANDNSVLVDAANKTFNGDVVTDVISEKTADSGVEIDNILLKDGKVMKLDDGAGGGSSTILDSKNGSTDAATFKGKVLDSNGNQVVGDQQAPEADVVALSSSNQGGDFGDLAAVTTEYNKAQADIVKLRTTINNLLGKLRAHGLIDTA